MVTLTLATAVQAGQTVTLDYVSGGGQNQIQDTEGNAAMSFTDWLVTNITGGGTEPPVDGGGGAPSATVPGAPTNLQADGGDEQVTLFWEAPENDGGFAITDYEVRINRRGSWISIGSTRTTHTVTGLVNGTIYVFQVRAVNAAGSSAPSNRAEATPRATAALDFAHFANGASWQSGLVFVNGASHPIRPALYFYDKEGDRIDPESVVDLTGDLEVQEDGALSIQRAMAPLGELTISTHGQGELVSGSVTVSANGPIGGVLRYAHPDIGVAGVGVGQPVRDALFPARRQAGGISTAAALHNLGEEAMTVSCRLMKDGIVLEEVEIYLAANGQKARYIEEVFTLTDTSDFVGSVRCTAPDLFTGVAVEIDAENRILTTLPVVPVARAGGGGQETVLNFAHSANGNGTTSDLVFVNVSTRPSGPGLSPYHAVILPSRPTLYFYDQEGHLIDPASVVDLTGDLVVTEGGALSIQTEMEPLGELTISTHGRGELVSGSVKVVSEGPLGGVLRYALPRHRGHRGGGQPSRPGRPLPSSPGGRARHGGGHPQPERVRSGGDLPIDERGRRARRNRDPSGGQRTGVPVPRRDVRLHRCRCVGLRGIGALHGAARGGNVHRSGRGDRCRQPDPHHAAGGAGAREDGSRIDKGSDPVVQGLSRSREGGVIRRDEGGAPRFDAPAGGYFRVLFSGFYPQKGYNPSLFVGVLFLGFQSDDLFTGVVAPTTCKSSICLTTCMGQKPGGPTDESRRH